MAVKLLRAGFRPVPLRRWREDDDRRGKRPFGKDWGALAMGRNEADLAALYARLDVEGVGLLLGPGAGPDGSWVVDIEIDAETPDELAEGEDSVGRLFLGDEPTTMAWDSARGRHRVFTVTPEFAGLVQAAGKEKAGSPGVFQNVPGFPRLEFRIGGVKADGTVKAIHSSIPPTLQTDGRPRTWNGEAGLVAAPMPDTALRVLRIAAASPSRQASEVGVGTTTTTAAAPPPAGPDIVWNLPVAADCGPASYWSKALEDEAAKVENAPPKGSNAALNTAAFRLGQIADACGQSDEAIIGRLMAACRIRRPGCDEESLGTIVGAVAAGRRDPRTPSFGTTTHHSLAPEGRPVVVSSPAPAPEFDGPPRPIRAELSPVMEVDPEAIPDVLRPWVVDVAERAGLPLDFPVAASFVMLGSLIGRRIAMRPKYPDDWLVVPNVWGAIVGDPSQKKTPAVREPEAMLKMLESEAEAAFKQRQLDRKADALIAKDSAADARKAYEAARKSGKASPEELRRLVLAANPDEDEEEERPRSYVVNDTSPEALQDLLAANPNGLLQTFGELTAFFASLERPGNEGARAAYLTMFDGDGSLRINRIGRGEKRIKSNTVALFGTIQPRLFAKHLAGSAYSESADGLAQRFQVCVYPDAKEYPYIRREPNLDARNAVQRLFRNIDAIPLHHDEWGLDAEAIPSIRFDDEAQELFDEWYQANDRRIASGGLPMCMALHLGKTPKLFAALSLIFHIVDNHHLPAERFFASQVVWETAARAGWWCKYFESHARRLYGLAGDGDLTAAANLAERIKAGRLPNPFTARDVYRNEWSGLRKPDEVRRAVATLETFGWVKVGGEPSQSGRPGETVERVHVNPAVASFGETGS
jgi:putative DNA primase/helicase